MTDLSSPPAQPAESGSHSSLIPPIVGSILLLLPAVTCVQAWLADAPGKIWLTGFAIVAIAIGIVAWKFRVHFVFWCGLIVAGVLIVAPAYLYGVDGAELAVAGIPFRIFIACLFLVALALAAWELARLPRLPLWARFIAPVFAFFAAIPVVMGLMKNAPFADILGGLWSLPYWMQGAWFGAAVLLPVALIVSLLRTGVPAWRSEPFRKPVAFGTIVIFLTATLATGFAMTTQGLIHAMAFVPVPAYQIAGPTVETVAGADTGAIEASQPVIKPTELPRVQIKDLGALVDLIVADAGDLPRAEFDPAALVDSLGGDPQDLFEWVRDRTWWAPYRGLLRGSKGVMLDRVGSNLDRAVLLGDLLRRAGHTVRLAHVDLPEGQARRLLDKVRPIPDQRRSPVPPKPVSAERQRAIEAIMPGFENAMQDEIAESKRYSDAGEALVRSQADQLFTAVRDLATRNDADDSATIAAIQDLWWVESEQDGNWVAMDVLLPDAKIGDAVATASSTSEWKAMDDAPSIPETDWHTVEIRVIVERYEGGTTSESIVLESLLRPAETLEQPIVLRHMPKPWPTEIPDFDTDPNALRNAALQVKEWVPFLQIGNDFVAQNGFADNGDLQTNPFDPVAAAGGGGMFGGFGAAISGDEKAETYATAEWIDYEIRVPGMTSQHLRRPVFDLLGPVRRSAAAAGFQSNTDALRLERFEALWSWADILLQPCEFTEEFIAHLASSDIVANQAAFKALSQERDPAKVRSIASAILDRVHVWGPLPNLVSWRSALGRKPADWFVDRPNVLNYRVTLPLADADRVAVRELIDIVSNATGVRRDGREGSFEVRLRRGVADTVAEMLTLGADLRIAENTAAVFSMEGAGPDNSVRIAPRDPAAVQKLGWPADTAARLAENIDAGFLAVVLQEPVLLRGRQRVGWWRVDPSSGETIGVMDTGFHAALTEEQIKRRDTLRTYVDKEKFLYRRIKERYPNPQTWKPDMRNFMARVKSAMDELFPLEYPTP